jgi:hypothetical protein
MGRSLVRVALLLGLAGIVGCGTSQPDQGFPHQDGGGGGVDDGSMGGSDSAAGSDGTLIIDDGSVVGDGATSHGCIPTGLDLSGCICTTLGATRACYTGPPATENVGLCKDGMQTCAGGETPLWGPCTGSVTPAPEVCNGTVDRNCNGKTGCNDPTCTTTPLCDTGCTNGQMRSCYTGPAGTENVGSCKDGMQVCSGGMWGTCTGEVLPAPENCCDPLDHNCNGLAGCYDLFACITASCCQSSCDAGGGLDPGCVCMAGSGDTATCPQGDHYVHKGGLPGTDECCPCTASDCTDFNCCGESICAGNSGCSGYTCNPVPASCNGQVSADCDDFPEDCDEPCCECTQGC